MNVHRRRLGILALGAVLIGALGAGVGWAAIPGTNGVISGCYGKQTGILRVIDKEAGKSCLSFEAPISWNEKGPPGPQGIQGLQGPKGKPGLVWKSTYSGFQSYDVDDAVQWLGSSYVAIAPVPSTCTIIGLTCNGPNAPPNPQYWDLLALKGDKGEAGSAGSQGPKGDQGLRWRGAWNEGEGYAIGDVVSYAGASWVAYAGQDGSPTVGHPPPENLNEWSLVADKGADGADGLAGPAGPQGPAGPAGPEGPAGPSVTLSTVRADGPAVFIGSFNSNSSEAVCPAGTVVTGGGFHAIGDNVTVNWSKRSGSIPTPGNGWFVSASSGLSGGQVAAHAICLQVN